jgi:hypothetical protein
MATKSKSTSSEKVTFVSRRSGKSKKRLGPKEKSSKKYQGQGR